MSETMTHSVDATSTHAATFADLMDAVRSPAEEVAAVHAPSVDKEVRLPRETLPALKAVGALSAAVPRGLGGLGGTTATASSKPCIN